MYPRYLKRVLDRVFAGAAVLFLLPLMLTTALAIWLEDRGPVFFRQRRVGYQGVPFQVWKFRSMPVTTAEVPSTDATTLNITRVGRVIRRTNIDELPQLINILRGEMSLVGPRPALPTQAALLTLRHENGAMACRPGLTGLAQINAYDHMPEEEKARWDGAYAAHLSFGRDALIIAKTFGYLLKRPPVY